LGCSECGEAVVVDPSRDVARYAEAAAAEGMRIAAVTETHIHADFVSGSRALAARTGARLYLSAEGGPEWSYGFAAEAGATLLRDGEVVRVGGVRLDVLHTPGHTPEHLSFLVTDAAAADRPIAALTGDFVFVGDVGRPDLLERAAGVAGTMVEGARALFRSLARFRGQPDWLQVWPGHGAGSACGKGLSAIPHSTVGYERLFNWAFAINDEDEFVAAVLAGQPEPPRYFARMKRVNRDGPPLLDGFPDPPRIPATELRGRLAGGAWVADLRDTQPFAAGHVPGTLNVPLNRSFPTWAGSLLPYDRDLYLVVPPGQVAEAMRDLALIGLDRVAGWFDAAEVAASGQAAERVPHVGVDEVRTAVEAGTVGVVDVRAESEWEAGHVPGAVHIPLGALDERLADVPRDRPLVLHCQGGARSAMAAALLQARGFRDVSNLAGGFRAWQEAGLPVEAPEPEGIPA
ncbi:MAG TPA: rhodanese-like domain-containing protein, partial [Longimicrobium sp.]|nr:rhodanese-like domain-containing protein [Longimicrobium sp.]